MHVWMRSVLGSYMSMLIYFTYLFLLRVLYVEKRRTKQEFDNCQYLKAEEEWLVAHK